MNNSELATLIFAAVVGILPGLLFWTAVLVFATRKIKQGGGKAERFLQAGAIVLIISTLSYAPILFTPLLLNQSRDVSFFITMQYINNLVRDIITMAGVGCFIAAFWLKFKIANHKPEAAAAAQ